MKIILLDNNPEMINVWRRAFFGTEGTVEIVESDFCEYMEKHLETDEIDGIVSPANSFGLMDGGYDGAITKFFGKELMKKVQEKIIAEHGGEQIVGTSISVEIPNFSGRFLIHSPTMRWPEPILDFRVVSDCMRTCILEAKRLNLNRVVIPAFGGCAGKVPLTNIGDSMYFGFIRAMRPNEEINWGILHGIKQRSEYKSNY